MRPALLFLTCIVLCVSGTQYAVTYDPYGYTDALGQYAAYFPDDDIEDDDPLNYYGSYGDDKQTYGYDYNSYKDDSAEDYDTVEDYSTDGYNAYEPYNSYSVKNTYGSVYDDYEPEKSKAHTYDSLEKSNYPITQYYYYPESDYSLYDNTYDGYYDDGTSLYDEKSKLVVPDYYATYDAYTNSPVTEYGPNYPVEYEHEGDDKSDAYGTYDLSYTPYQKSDHGYDTPDSYDLYDTDEDTNGYQDYSHVYDHYPQESFPVKPDLYKTGEFDNYLPYNIPIVNKESEMENYESYPLNIPSPGSIHNKPLKKYDRYGKDQSSLVYVPNGKNKYYRFRDRGMWKDYEAYLDQQYYPNGNSNAGKSNIDYGLPEWNQLSKDRVESDRYYSREPDEKLSYLKKYDRRDYADRKLPPYSTNQWYGYENGGSGKKEAPNYSKRGQQLNGEEYKEKYEIYNPLEEKLTKKQRKYDELDEDFYKQTSPFKKSYEDYDYKQMSPYKKDYEDYDYKQTSPYKKGYEDYDYKQMSPYKKDYEEYDYKQTSPYKKDYQEYDYKQTSPYKKSYEDEDTKPLLYESPRDLKDMELLQDEYLKFKSAIHGAGKFVGLGGQEKGTKYEEVISFHHGGLFDKNGAHKTRYGGYDRVGRVKNYGHQFAKRKHAIAGTLKTKGRADGYDNGYWKRKRGSRKESNADENDLSYEDVKHYLSKKSNSRRGRNRKNHSREERKKYRASEVESKYERS